VNKVKATNSGKYCIREPGLDVLLRDAESDGVIIAVPTPVKDEVADLS